MALSLLWYYKWFITDALSCKHHFNAVAGWEGANNNNAIWFITQDSYRTHHYGFMKRSEGQMVITDI